MLSLRSQGTSSPFSITLFGPIQVAVAGETLPRLRSRKSLWLLALLVLRPGRPVEREWLAGALWPDADQYQALAGLRSALSDLRKALRSEGQRLRSPSRHTLSLELAGAEVDVAAFDAAISAKSLTALAGAVSLYKGPLLEGCGEEWAGQERAAREHDCLLALLKLADAALAAGDHTAATDYAQRAVGLAPWRDEARRSLMAALAGAGDANAALHVYREFAALLQDDPKAAPDTQTTALYRQMRSEARQLASGTEAESPVRAEPTVRGYLPHSLTDLVGREDEREDVATLLRGSRLVTLTGPGGIGKTRLAVAVADESAGHYSGGVWLVALDAVSDGARVPAQIAGVFGLKEEPDQTLLECLAGHLRERRLLLVLDNCEHLLDDSARVAGYLLRECAGLRVLATSREALGITGETVWLVPGLSVPDLAHLPAGPATLARVLSGYGSVQLFVERAQAVQKGFELTRSNAATVAQVCARLEGIPLAIELAAARVRGLTVAQMAARLDDHLELLTGGCRAAPSRQRTLRATLDWSYARLSIPEQLLLARVSVFAGGWTLGAAESVCAGEGIEPEHVLDLLTGLVDKSLVTFRAKPAENSVEGGRYRLLEMVRQYAGERLGVGSPAARLGVRHREWFSELAEEADPLSSGPAQTMWLSRMEAEDDNLRKALEGCEEDTPGAEGGMASEKHLQFAGALCRYWSSRGHFIQGRAYLQRALTGNDAPRATAARGRALKGAGILSDRQGDYASARVLYEQRLDVFRELGDTENIASALGDLNDLARRQGDAAAAQVFSAEAWAVYEQRLGVFRELGDKNNMALTLHYLGVLALSQEDYAAVRNFLTQSLVIFRELGDKNMCACQIHNLGAAAYFQGDHASARALFAESLGIFRDVGDKSRCASGLNDMGELAFEQGDCVSSQAYHEESLGLYRELGDQDGIAGQLEHLGARASFQGDSVSARAYHEESLGIYQELGNKRSVALQLRSLGFLAHREGDCASARTWYEQSLQLRRELEDQRLIAGTLNSLVSVLGDQGDFATARALQGESLRLCQELGDWSKLADGLEGMAALMLAQAQIRKAVQLWGAARSLQESRGAPQLSFHQEKYDQQVRHARSTLGNDAFADAWAEGFALSWEEAAAVLDDARVAARHHTEGIV